MPNTIPTIITFDTIGEVAFYKNRRYKRLSIKVRADDRVRVLIPPGYDIKDAVVFVQEKLSWIQQSLKKLEERRPRPTIFDESTEFKSRSFSLRVEGAKRNDVRMYYYNGVLKVQYPDHIPVSHPRIQELIRSGIVEALRREAKHFLPRRLEELAKDHGFTYRVVTVKNLKSRWGSCSTVNNINLNLHLMRLPDSLIDYVLIHELCHTVEKNHGPGFWNLLDKCTGGKARQLDAEMKKYRTQLF